MDNTENIENKTEKKNEPTFEDAMRRLQEIVTFLEGGEVPLDKSLAAFEEGVSLVKFCTNALENAEKTVKLLTFSENGEVAEGEMPPMDQ